MNSNIATVCYVRQAIMRDSCVFSDILKYMRISRVRNFLYPDPGTKNCEFSTRRTPFSQIPPQVVPRPQPVARVRTTARFVPTLPHGTGADSVFFRFRSRRGASVRPLRPCPRAGGVNRGTPSRQERHSANASHCRSCARTPCTAPWGAGPELQSQKICRWLIFNDYINRSWSASRLKSAIS